MIDYAAERAERDRAVMALFDHLHLPLPGMFRATINGREFTDREEYAAQLKAFPITRAKGVSIASRPLKAQVKASPLTKVERECLGKIVAERHGGPVGQVWSLSDRAGYVFVVVPDGPDGNTTVHLPFDSLVVVGECRQDVLA